MSLVAGSVDVAADVVVDMIASFGSKAAIAKELLDVSIVGDDEPVPVAGRPWFQRVYDEGIDGHERLRRYASAVRRIYVGAGSTYEIIRRGADDDADLAEIWANNQRARRTVVAQILDAALADSGLRPGLERAEAEDLLWMLHGPEVFHMLTVDCGWDADRFESWLADTFCEQLLGPPRQRG